MMAVYQGSAVSCAMFMTGQASNVLVAGYAAKLAGLFGENFKKYEGGVSAEVKNAGPATP